MRHVEPRGAFVVEVRQRALGQALGADVVLGDQTRIANRADAALAGVTGVARPWAGDEPGEFQYLLFASNGFQGL